MTEAGGVEAGKATEGEAQMQELYQAFNRKLARALAIAGGVIIPVGIIISTVFAGWRGLAGSFIGFGVASLYTMASLWIMKWSFNKPLRLVPAIMMSTLWARLIVVGGVLYGLTFAHALNRYALFGSFLALFLAYSALEITYAWKTFGVLFKPPSED